MPEKLKVMCYGDSITDGFWLEGGYRTTLCRLLEENSLSERVEFVGINHSGNCYSNAHSGFPSFSIEDIKDSITGGRMGIASFADEIFQRCSPDVVLLQIGTNDILSDYRLDEAGDRLKRLAERIFEAIGENGRLYMASIPCMDAADDTYIPTWFYSVESMDKAVSAFNNKVRETAEALAAEGKNVFFADMNKVLDKKDLKDGVHPDEKGYEKMGEFWFGIIKNELNGF